ncbi:DUF4230 domain-containing protein [Erythrobacter litoralis]|uniref:DUF4230 domain-containing protein n=1 Tax=Erythrobacter litoralis (strain HTCC2594) TaxID=314225 RepID=Q2NDQ5_ERYLH|nr:DUF4230 domain-containing protein [Erythrobacter litoralis]ABC62186.1 hypothetical protein ELI_00470 [Erythrobacter litoralis HTCC2594]
MADNLKNAESSADTLVPEPERQKPLARVQAVPWMIVILLIAAVAWLGWKAFGPDELGDPIGTSLVAFEEQNALTVFSAEFAPVVSSEDSRFFGTINTRQVAVIPTRVSYSVDLSQVDRSRLDWNEQDETLTVQLPQISVGKPNLDEARAQYLREGIWISREAQDKLTRDNTQLAEREARKQAANPILLNLARDAARQAVTQNLAIPLEVAGYGDVEVVVRFDGEAGG